MTEETVKEVEKRISVKCTIISINININKSILISSTYVTPTLNKLNIFNIQVHYD